MPSATMKSTAHPFQTDDSRLLSVHEKVLAEQALDLDDITALYVSKDILAIGWLANFVRERMHGGATQFAVNTVAANSAGGELLIVARDFEAALRGVDQTRKEHPLERIAALTVEQLATQANPAEAARQLKRAGADSLLGDGAEIFLPELRRSIWQTAISIDARAEAIQVANEAGLETPLYVVQRGRSPEEQARELMRFRAWKAERFAAISFDPDATTSASLNVTTGMQEMRHIAIARLALPNVAHIRAYWQMLGGKLSQIALSFGASELDGTALDAGVNAAERSRELAREISVAGREPKEIPPVRKLVMSL
jgi:aminodeoxyfutalosine synthase